MDDVVLTGWYVGWGIGAAVVVVVAALVLAIIGYASRIARQADEITAALRDARDHTEPLWRLVEVNRDLERAIGGPAGPRHVLKERS